MFKIPVECLPESTIYYSATTISHREQTRFDIKTTMRHPNGPFFSVKRPIESVLLYHYKTPLGQIQPVEIDNQKLNQVDLGMLNRTNSEDPSINQYQIYRNRPCFSFQYPHPGPFEAGWTIQLPKLVLARDLFFSHPYLLRAALFAERYTSDVLVDHEDTKAVHIYIAPNKKITAKDLKDPIFLKKLTLILLHPELNKSFLSIYEKTIENQKGAENYNFDMDAPMLQNIQLDVSGESYPDTKIYRIERIKSFGNLETKLEKPVQFHFLSQKSFKQAKDILDTQKSVQRRAIQDKSKLNDEANADIDQQIAQLRNQVGQIYTVEDLKIQLSTSRSDIHVKKQNKHKNISSDKEQSFAGGEAEDEGTLPGFTIQSENDSKKSEIESENHSYEDFNKMLNELKNKGYQFENIHHQSFIKFSRFRGHKLANGKDREFYVSLIMENGKELFYLCEIDTSDGKKNISTFLLPFTPNTKKLFQDENLKVFKKVILSQSLRWPKEFINEVYGIKNFITINHPSKKDIELSISYYINWAERILEKWKLMKGSLS